MRDQPCYITTSNSACMLCAVQVGSSGFDEGVRVKTRHFEEKAREYNIADLEPFYTSHHFTANGFTKDDASGFIVFQRAAEQETQ